MAKLKISEKNMVNGMTILGKIRDNNPGFGNFRTFYYDIGNWKRSLEGEIDGMRSTNDD